MKASSNPVPVQLEGHQGSPEVAVDGLSRESGVFPPEPDSGTRVVPTERWRHLTRDVLDRLAVPVMVLDARARIEFTNEAARTLVARADGLRRRGAFLEADDPRDTAALHALVRAAARVEGSPASAPSGTLSIRRSSEGEPVHLFVAPLTPRPSASNRDARGLVIVIAGRPELRSQRAAAELHARYGLTPTEAKLALLVADGSGLAAVAERMGIYLSTARTHLHRVFDKTGTRRQAQLTRLLETNPAMMLADGDELLAGREP